MVEPQCFDLPKYKQVAAWTFIYQEAPWSPDVVRTHLSAVWKDTVNQSLITGTVHHHSVPPAVANQLPLISSDFR